MTISGIITAIIIGAIIGALARLVLPGKQNISILLTIVVGIVAAIIGTLIAQAVGVSDTPRPGVPSRVVGDARLIDVMVPTSSADQTDVV